MGVFLALGSIAFAFGDTILPEIQVSLASMHTSCSATTQLASSFHSTSYVIPHTLMSWHTNLCQVAAVAAVAPLLAYDSYT